MRFKLYIALLSAVFLTQAQFFSEDKEVFRQQVVKRIQSIGTESSYKISYDFQKTWDAKYTSVQQDRIHQMALKMQKKHYSFFPYFYHYFTYLAYAIVQEGVQRDEFNHLLTINEAMLKSLNKKDYGEYLYGMNIYFARRYFTYEKDITVQAPGGSYVFGIFDDSLPIEEAQPGDPYINIQNALVIMTTPHDEITIRNVSGYFLLKNRVFIGQEGIMDWPGENIRFRGAQVIFKDFFIKKDRAEFHSQDVTLYHNELLGEHSVTGTFLFKSPRRGAQTLSQYPIFTSHEANHSLTLEDSLHYVGGLQLSGNALYGRSESNEEGRLTITVSDDRIFTLTSKYFVLNEDKITLEEGKFVLHHGVDSIYHRSVQAQFAYL